MNPIRFGIIGGGWRALFFIRVAQALPHMFEIPAIVVRDPAKAQAIAQQWKVRTVSSMEELLSQHTMDFVVLSVPRKVHPQLLGELAARQMPVLCETPPAKDVDEMLQVWELLGKGLKIQIAEQLHLRPLHAARIAIARSGLLGHVHQAQVAVAHGYHGVSLIRRLLGVGFEPAVITARLWKSSIVAGPDRAGPPAEEKMEKVVQELAWLDFGDRLGVFDFAGSQYFSYIRTTRMLVQGDRGEICDDQLRYLKDYRTPITTQLRRLSAGENDNLEGCYFKGIIAGDQWVYENPFTPARLSDDEIAVAASLVKMQTFVKEGKAFYSLAEACQDHYLGLLITQAAKTGTTITSQKMAWCP